MQVKVNVPVLEIEVAPGKLYTFGNGEIAEIENPREYARVCQIPGVNPVTGPMPQANPVPSRGPGRPRKVR